MALSVEDYNSIIANSNIDVISDGSYGIGGIIKTPKNEQIWPSTDHNKLRQEEQLSEILAIEIKRELDTQVIEQLIRDNNELDL